jgi:hypothetical protein
MQRRGNYSWIFALSLGVFFGFAALGIDFFRLQAVKTQAQNGADAAALAALIEFRQSGDTDNAEAAATYVTEQNLVGETIGGMEIDITWGTWDFNLDRSLAWTEGGTPANAVRARIGRTEASASGELPYLLASAIGYDSVELWGHSIAALRYREILVVLDITGSFVEEFDEAREAVIGFLDTIYDKAMPGDQIGLVTFVGAANLYTPLSPVTDNYSAIRASWAGLSTCHLWDEMYNNFYQFIDVSFDGEKSWTPMSQDDFLVYMGNDAPHMSPCYFGSDEPPMSYTDSDTWDSGAGPYYKEAGTSPGDGITTAITEFADSGDEHATKVIILISDGLPQCTGEGESCDQWRVDYGVDSADAAFDDQDISIFSVSFNNPADSDQTDYMTSLVRGDGEFFETPDADDLPEILQTIANAIPTTIVK